MNEARRQDCRVFVTLTDYDEAIHSFDPAISAAILATAESRRRHAVAVAAWCRDTGVAGVDLDWEALTAEQRDPFSQFVEELAKALHRRRAPDRGGRLPQDARARRLGRAPRAGLGATRPSDRPTARDDLQLLGLLVRTRTPVAARLDRQRARLRGEAGAASQDRHGPRPVRARLARRHARPTSSGTTSRPSVRREESAPRAHGRTSHTAETAPATPRTSQTPRPSTPSTDDARATRASVACCLAMGQEDPRAWRELARALHTRAPR